MCLYIKKICILLNEYINKYSEYKSNLINEESSYEINYDLDFVIYIDSVSYNPLNFKNIIRWVINFTNEELYKTYNSNDILFPHP